MKFAVVTPFSRFGNGDILIKHLEPFGIIWHPVVRDKDLHKQGWAEEWIRPLIYVDALTFDVCYAKLNDFIASGLIENDVYYSFLNDDDFYEPGFFDKIRERCSGQEPVIVVSMKTGNNSTLIADRKTMSEGFVGLEQLIIRGDILKGLRFAEDSHSADGKMAAQVAGGAKYLPDVFVLFNYLELGRWKK